MSTTATAIPSQPGEKDPHPDRAKGSNIETRHTDRFGEVVARESGAIRRRRQSKRLPHSEQATEKSHWTGLSLSGGGIRSACFNLGLLEAFDQKAYKTSEEEPRGPGANGNLEADNGSPETQSLKLPEDTRYLELFDYLSTVSGGSYVAGHLTTTLASPEDPATQAGSEDGPEDDGPRFGEIAFTTNSVPRWFWILGVWFLGAGFQLLKTGSLLVAILGLVALLCRVCDSQSTIRFCDAIGLQTDVTRGFVPFWVMLGVFLVAYGLRKRVRLFWLWLIACLTVVAVFDVSIYVSCRYDIALPFSFHLAFFSIPTILALGIGFGIWIRKRIRRSEGTEPTASARNPSRNATTNRDQRPESTEPEPQLLFVLPMLTALVCLAGLVTTGDITWKPTPIDVGDVQTQSQDLSRLLSDWGSKIYYAAIAALGLISMAFLRWRDLLRSGRQVTDRLADSRWQPVYRVIVFLCSYGLLLLLVFVLYGAVARENISRYFERRAADPAAAFHPADFKENGWERAWEQIADDAEDENQPWHSLADKLQDAPRHDHPLSAEMRITTEIDTLEAMPWSLRVLVPYWFGYAPNLKPPFERAPRYHTPAMTIYYRKFELNKLRIDVAKKVATDVLSDSGLHKIVPKVDEIYPVSRLQSMTPEDRQEYLQKRSDYFQLYDKYLHRAKYLEGLVSGDNHQNSLKAAIARNNRLALHLYLDDRMLDRRKKIYFASIIWAEDQWTRARVIVCAAVIWILCGIVPPNVFSLHGFYHEHIRKQWIRKSRGPQGTGWLFENRDCRYRSGRRQVGSPGASRTDVGPPLVKRRAPLLLINATVQGNRATGDEPKLAQNIFTFSSAAAGSCETGYWINGTDKDGNPHNEFVRHNDLDVGQMVAISGAFLSPGQVANPALAAVLHLLNIRTGWWVRRPNVKTIPLTPSWFLFNIWHSLGIDRKGDDYHLLTDGAHVENLGLKVLLDRRCSLIVASDCSQGDEPGHCFGALTEVLRQARLDGIEIGPFLSPKAYRHWLMTDRIQKVGKPGPDCQHKKSWGFDLIVPAPPPGKDKDKDEDQASASGQSTSQGAAINGAACQAPDAGFRLAQEHFLFAHIRYPKLEAHEPGQIEEGLLIYLRPTLTGDEHECLLRSGSSFPDDPALDQFYTAAKMNTYRLLGRHIGSELAEDLEFQRALRRIYSGQPAVPNRPQARPAPAAACATCSADQICDTCLAADACNDCSAADACAAHLERAYRPPSVRRNSPAQPLEPTLPN